MSEEATSGTALSEFDAAPGENDAALPNTSKPRGAGPLSLLAISAIGIVFGDLGTSPLYAFRECFALSSGVQPTRGDVLGVLSLIVWTLILIVSLKYAVFIMRADNDGEGGILALLALAMRGPRDRSSSQPGRRRGVASWLLLLGLFGAALLYGDGVITPAVSVLSALEGITIAAPSFAPFVVPSAFVILLALFALQHKGTARVGAAFGPVMMIWFITIAVLGIAALVRHPEALAALSPMYAMRFFGAHGWMGMRIFGGLALVITGAEALFADIGHFGTRPIRLAWFGLVLPALLLNYLGQGALLLESPQAAEYPFFHLVSGSWRYPLIAIATCASIIASQGLISASFSLARQAVQLDFSPRIKLVHTSKDVAGQIYVPVVNHALMIACLAVVLGFRTSPRLSAAFGLAVTLTMAITTLLFCFVARQRWRWPLWLVVVLGAFFLAVDLAFAGVNLLKLRQGGWLPLLIGATVFLLMTTWRTGHQAIERVRLSRSMPVDHFIDLVREQRPYRSPGTAVFLTSRQNRASPALVEHLEHAGAIHEQIILLTVALSRRPYVRRRDRVKVTHFPEGFAGVLARYGFMEAPRMSEIMAAAAHQDLHVRTNEATYFVERDVILPTGKKRMHLGRKKLFAFMARNARPPWEFFEIPPNRVIEFGSGVQL